MPKTTPISFAFSDLTDSIKCWRVWFLLGTNEVRARYARAAFGQLWQTLSLLMLLAGMALVYSNLLNIEWRQYISYLACSFVAWTFISQLIIDGTTTFSSNEAYLKNYNLPLFTFPMKAVVRGLIVLGHNLVAAILVLIAAGQGINVNILMFIPAALVYCIIGISVGVVLGYLGARYRDIVPLVTNLMQIIFFMTPVMFPPESARGRFLAFLKLNPFEQLLAIGRGPLRGLPPTLLSWQVSLSLAAISFIIALICVGAFKRKIVYWL